MVKIRGEVRQESVTRFMFKAPKIPVAILIILVLSLAIDITCMFVGFKIDTGFTHTVTIFGQDLFFFGLAFSVPALISILLTKPVLNSVAKDAIFTWRRSGLLALACDISMIILMISAVALGADFAYVFGIGFIFGLRLFVLCGVVDYRARIMLVPALIQPVAGFIIGILFFGQGFAVPAIVSLTIFGFFMTVLVNLIDLPLKKTCGISGMEFANMYMQMNDGKNSMEEYLRRISEPVSVPATTFFFKREAKSDVWFVVPNLHPGPMADIGGSNFPKLVHDHFEDEAVVLVSHGCASHDLNLISNRETSKIIDAVTKSKKGAVYSGEASRPVRSRFGAVSILSQRFGDSILMVTTRSPEMTEDMDYSIGRIVMGEGRGKYRNIGFVDAHNCMHSKGHIIYPSTEEGNEFISGAVEAFDSMLCESMHPLKVGVSSVKLPFSRDQGFGDMELITMVTEAGSLKTAFVLLDGNNVKAGVRDVLRDEVLKLGVDEAEILSTDTHVVNALSGMNPVGLNVSADEMMPYIADSVKKAIADLDYAEVGSATEICKDVNVFGPGKITQLTALAGSIITNIPIYLLSITVISFLTVMLVCWVVLV